jgi:hypothetical protein
MLVTDSFKVIRGGVSIVKKYSADVAPPCDSSNGCGDIEELFAEAVKTFPLMECPVDHISVKGTWSGQEDKQLRSAVAKSDRKHWSNIAAFVPGRTGKQCRERWHNHLNPSIKKGAWDAMEDHTIAWVYRHYGAKWSLIARLLHGRTDIAIKNIY